MCDFMIINHDNMRLAEVQVVKQLLYTVRGLGMLLDGSAPEPDDEHDAEAQQAAANDMAPCL